MSDDLTPAAARDDLNGQTVRVTVELPDRVLVSEGIVGSLTLTVEPDGRRTVAIVVTEAKVTQRDPGVW